MELSLGDIGCGLCKSCLRQKPCVLNRGLEHAQEADARARKLRDRKHAAEKRKRDLGRAERAADALRESTSLTPYHAQLTGQPGDGGANRGGAAGPAGATGAAGIVGTAGVGGGTAAAEPSGPGGSVCSLCRGFHAANRCPLPAFLSVTVPLGTAPSGAMGRPRKQRPPSIQGQAEEAASRAKKQAKAAEQAEQAAWVESLSTPKMDAMIAVHRLASAQVGARGPVTGGPRPQLPPKALREMSEVLEQFIVQRLAKH